MLFFESRGALAGTEGVNRRLEIFKFVTVFNSQQPQANPNLRRQPAPTPANTPKEPNRGILLKGEHRRPDKAALRPGSRRHGHPWVGAARAHGRSPPPGPTLCCPTKAAIQYLLFAPPPRSGGGKRDAVALEECAKWGEKKQLGSTSHPGSSSLIRL